MNDKQDVSRNDLALRIATDVLGDPSRAGGLAEYFAKENTDVYRALERFAESRCATARAEERERAVRAALTWAWYEIGDGDHRDRHGMDPGRDELVAAGLSALTPTPEPRHA